MHEEILVDGKRIICIAPCYNELNKIEKVAIRMKESAADEFLVVDDGSTDGSAEAAENEGAKVIRTGKTSGAGYAIRMGIDYALSNQFDIIVITAGSNKDSPAEIRDLVKPIADDSCDLVQGSRFIKGGKFRKMPFYRVAAVRLHSLLFSLIAGKWITDSTNGFRAIRASVLMDSQIHLHQDWLNKYELEPYILFKAIKLGYRTAEVPVTKIYPPKELGYTKMKPVTGWWSILRPLLLLGLGIRQ
jgi:dolichol-phosphate mannosyltransferase